MKTILVDAWNTFVKEHGIDKDIKVVLEKFPNPKIIVTNANNNEMIKLGITNMPYPVFSLSHNPNKIDPTYFGKLLQKYKLNANDVIYFEHNKEAFTTAKSLGIKSLWFKKNQDINTLKAFLKNNL